MYKIVGADQKEYGPVDQAQVRAWITQGRANAQTIGRFEDGPWKPLGTFPEFSDLFPAGAVPAAAPPAVPSAAVVVSSGPPKSSGMAVAGLVFGIFGFLSCCSPITSTLGLIFSILGLNQINENPRVYSGKPLAIAGIVLSILGYLTSFLILPTAFHRFHREFHWRF